MLIKIQTMRTTVPAFIMFVFLMTPGIDAQDDERPDTVYLMEEIVVTSEPRAETSEMTIGEDRIATQDAGTAAEQLSRIPGAFVTVGSKNSAEIMIRGFDADETLVMINGRPINEPYYGKMDLSTIGMGNISRIRIVKGATSVRYGPNAMAGVVNIITDEDTQNPLDIQMSGGSGAEFRADVTGRGRMQGIGYIIHAGRNTLNGFPVAGDFQPTSYENGDSRNNSDFRRTDLDAKLLFGQADNPAWRLSMSSSQLTKGLPGSVYDPRYWRFKRWQRISADIDGEPVRSDSFRLKTKVYFDRFINELIDYSDDRYDPSDIYWDSTHDNRSAGALLSSSFIGNANGITNAGIQIRWEESNRQADTGLDWFRNRTATNWIFAEHERVVTENLLIRGGLSGSLFTYKSWTKTSASIDPSLYAEWNLHGTILSGSVSRTSRFPTLNQLFSTTSGNSDLNPEWALKGELSVSRTFPGNVKCTLTGYANRVHDMIYRAGKLNKYTNIETASLDGFEVSGETAHHGFEISPALTILNARDSGGQRLAYRPQWKFDLYGSWKFHYQARIYILSQSVGSRRTEYKTDLDPYHVQDVGILFFELGDISGSIRVRNIFDIDYEEEYGYPMAGRSFHAGLDIHLGE